MKWISIESYFGMYKNQGYEIQERLMDVLTDNLIVEVSTSYPKRNHKALNIEKMFNALGLNYCSRCYNIPEINIKKTLFDNALCMRSLCKDVYLTFQPFHDSGTIFNILKSWTTFLMYMKNNNLRLDIYEGIAWDIRKPQTFMMLREIKGSELHKGGSKIYLHKANGIVIEFSINISLKAEHMSNESADWNKLNTEYYERMEFGEPKRNYYEIEKTG